MLIYQKNTPQHRQEKTTSTTPIQQEAINPIPQTLQWKTEIEESDKKMWERPNPTKEQPIQAYKFEPSQWQTPVLQQKNRNSPQQEQIQTPTTESETALPTQLKAGIENLSGLDMSDVKVHYNSNKPTQLQAHAYAQGTDIHLATGQEKHLPHEAWHVVQQKQGRVKPTLQMKGVNVNDDVGLEKEADVMGAKALQMQKKDNHFYPFKATIEQPIIQGKLIFYDKNGKEENFSSLDDVVQYIQTYFNQANASASKIVKYLNDQDSTLNCNKNLLNHFIATSADTYLSEFKLPKFLEEIAEFYKTQVASFAEDAGKIEKTKEYTDLIETYDETEADDGQSVGVEYDKNLACTLYALLAVKGSYLGVNTPKKLHKILVSMDKFKEYDEDNIVGLIRMQAGLSYSKTYSGKKVSEMINSLGQNDKNKKFIIDLDGVAHTFALKYESGAWKRFDNGSENGYEVGADIGSYASKYISVTWQ